MPGKVQTSGLFQKYGKRLDTAIQECAGKPIEYGPIQLPPGINGIARLVDCGFGVVAPGKQNAGEYYFRAAGVIVSPPSVLHNGVEIPIAGQQTSIMEMVCDTKTQAGKVMTLAEHVHRITNEMKKLAGSADLFEGSGGADLESIAAALRDRKPYFRFSTSVRKSNKAGQPDGVWENWHGGEGLEDYKEDAEEVAVDHTEAAEEEEEKKEETPKKRVRKSKTAEPTEEFSEFGDLASLVESATAGDAGAQDRLSEMAVKAGASSEDVDNAPDWQAVADLIGGGKEEEAEEEAEDWEPMKGQVYEYHPMDPKTKKPAKTGVQCLVQVVDKKGKTVSLTNLTNPKAGPYPKVPWGDLVRD